MLKQQAKAAGRGEMICNHTFRTTGNSVYLINNETIEHAQQTAFHVNPKTAQSRGLPDSPVSYHGDNEYDADPDDPIPKPYVARPAEICHD